ncbi:unnamed protein product [Owenia fusiformis]|uniref:Uncharacterized protein n=1 Tax=Owenia fusiformis TaxID=6347 RepID=A0A8S4N4G8_OWEFU|nr:unnamed protein product [Owenia fusiformis]
MKQRRLDTHRPPSESHRCDGYKNCRIDGTDELDCPPTISRPASSVYSSMVFFAFFLVCAVLLAKYCVSATRRRNIRNTRVLHTSPTNDTTEPASSHELDDRMETGRVFDYTNDLSYMPPSIIRQSNMAGRAISASANGNIPLPPKYEDIDFSKPENSDNDRTPVQVPQPPPYEAGTTSIGALRRSTASPVDTLTPVEVPPPYEAGISSGTTVPLQTVASASVLSHSSGRADASVATLPQQAPTVAASLPAADNSAMASGVVQTSSHPDTTSHGSSHACATPNNNDSESSVQNESRKNPNSSIRNCNMPSAQVLPHNNTNGQSCHQSDNQRPPQNTDRSATQTSSETIEGFEQSPNDRRR